MGKRSAPIVERDPSKPTDLDPFTNPGGNVFQALTGKKNARSGGRSGSTRGGKGGGGGGGGSMDQADLMTHSGNMEVWVHGQKARIDVDKAHLMSRIEGRAQMAGHAASKVTIENDEDAVHVAELHDYLAQGDYAGAKDLIAARKARLSGVDVSDRQSGVHGPQMRGIVEGQRADEKAEQRGDSVEEGSGGEPVQHVQDEGVPGAKDHPGFTAKPQTGQAEPEKMTPEAEDSMRKSAEAGDVGVIDKVEKVETPGETPDKPYSEEDLAEASKKTPGDRLRAGVNRVQDAAARGKEKAAAGKAKAQDVAANVRDKAADANERRARLQDRYGEVRWNAKIEGEVDKDQELGFAEKEAAVKERRADADTQVLNLAALQRKRDEKGNVRPVQDVPRQGRSDEQVLSDLRKRMESTGERPEPAAEPRPNVVGESRPEEEAPAPPGRSRAHFEAGRQGQQEGEGEGEGGGGVSLGDVAQVAAGVASGAAAGARVPGGPYVKAAAATVGGVVGGAGAANKVRSQHVKAKLEPTAKGNISIHVDKGSHPDWEGLKDQMRAHVKANPNAQIHVLGGGPNGGTKRFAGANVEDAISHIESKNQENENG